LVGSRYHPSDDIISMRIVTNLPNYLLGIELHITHITVITNIETIALKHRFIGSNKLKINSTQRLFFKPDSQGFGDSFPITCKQPDIDVCSICNLDKSRLKLVINEINRILSRSIYRRT